MAYLVENVEWVFLVEEIGAVDNESNTSTERSHLFISSSKAFKFFLATYNVPRNEGDPDFTQQAQEAKQFPIRTLNCWSATGNLTVRQLSTATDQSNHTESVSAT